MQVPALIKAGEPMSVVVGATRASDGTQVTLFAQGSYGMRIYQAVFRRGEATFALPGSETQELGVVSLLAQVGTVQAFAYLTIQPAPPIEPLTPLVGARFIIADASHWSMTIVIPFDIFGNPIQEGTPVQIEALHPGDVLDKKIVPISHLLAWRRVYSRTKAGRTVIAAQVAQIHGFEGTLLEVPGWPVPFSISAEPQPLPADGQLLTTLRSTIIRDKFGNMMPDGTIVMFIIEEPDGTRSFVPTYTIDGVATTSYQAPRVAGRMRMYATVLGVQSSAYTLIFTAGPAIGKFPVNVQNDPVDKAYLLNAGPLLGKLGQYIPDGTPVHFQLTSRTGRQYSLDGVSDAGYARVEIIKSLYAPGSYNIQASAGSGQGSGKLVLP